MAEPARSGCPINAAVEAFGDSWSLLVLRDVMFGNKRYFRELLAGSEEKIAIGGECVGVGRFECECLTKT